MNTNAAKAMTMISYSQYFATTLKNREGTNSHLNNIYIWESIPNINIIIWIEMGQLMFILTNGKVGKGNYRYIPCSLRMESSYFFFCP